ncbi:ATP synthase F1 subunit delta [Brooklawnia sp.]|uniref:ATP synthase F1 subunit delta n=1 Tax=Brooklawnia sp. TaxID=2699740 RepID=UPI003120532F
METEIRMRELDAKADSLQLQQSDIDGLAAVCDALAGQARLRGALSDATLSCDARSRLARTLLSGRVSDKAAELVAEAAARCKDSRDLEDLVERLAVRASLRAGGQIDQVSEEVFRFARAVQSDPELQKTLTDPRIGLAARQELIGTLVAAKVRPQSLWLLQRALTVEERPLVKTLDSYVELAAQVQASTVAKVSVAHPLTDGQLAHLKAQLVRIYGVAIDVRVEIDPDVLGGVRIQVGDEIIDGTIENRLNQARRLIG